MIAPREGERSAQRRIRRAKWLAYTVAVLVAAGVVALIAWRLFARPF